MDDVDFFGVKIPYDGREIGIYQFSGEPPFDLYYRKFDIYELSNIVKIKNHPKEALLGLAKQIIDDAEFQIEHGVTRTDKRPLPKGWQKNKESIENTIEFLENLIDRFYN